jgi:hypothetical protein
MSKILDERDVVGLIQNHCRKNLLLLHILHEIDNMSTTHLKILMLSLN